MNTNEEVVEQDNSTVGNVGTSYSSEQSLPDDRQDHQSANYRLGIKNDIKM